MNRTAKIALMVMVDLLALPVCFLVAMLLRLGDAASALQYPAAFLLVPLLTVGAFSLSDLYRAVIRFIDQRMLAVTGFTLALATLSVYLIMVGINNDTFPRSALVIYWFIAFSYVVTSRMTVRNFLRKQMNDAPTADHAVAIYGAGEPGAQLALTMRTSNQYRPVCFFDDKRAFNERTIAGLRVFHTERLADTVRSLGVRSVIIALPSVSPQRLRDIMQRLAMAGVNTRILCRLLDLADDATPLQAVRDLKFEDLLGRKPVPPRTDLFDRCVRGKRVLVTGAGGSIGSELCRQIVTLAPAHLHLVDHSEFALYTIRQELLGRHPDMRISAHLGSVCSARLVERILQENTIDTIYHAAAYKHVPLVESNIVAGLRNNVLGSQVIAAAAAKFKVRTCVLISSDKAVRPTNIMGASKRIAELIFQAAATTHGTETTFCMVRFGNVLGSSGSVIPLFQRQLAHGGPLTITHPDVSRYFMLIAEAAQLVIQAGAMAEGGDVFVLDMGEPVRIVDLARSMIMMSGLTEKTAQNPEGDIGLKFVGLFPGEKLYEELLTDGKVFPSDHPRIMRMKEHALDPGVLDTYITCLMLACNTHDRGMIESMVKAMVSEYTPQPNGAPVHRSPAAVSAPDKNRPALLRDFSPDRIE
ncbi:polysaccharide biosynthesis protein [Massilia scottii]|uniref:polysaccharide biosynthesis protein n=1 Tax=Massilia scottii TaxID=3057166 RepID=UPI0027964F0A|nr:nucleoside-diphosphate sugar epimerase/dehydratase [Massilia sp. CCM 9029]MDQ1832160.1 nucleoside-diphosphate sugar epimerase/dehydratase [Massilia sp. CCM 9029]